MSRRFVVGLDKVHSEQPFTDYVTSKGYAWWHWIQGFWMIVDYDGDLDCAKLRDDLNSIYPNVRKIVIEMPPFSNSESWAGYGPLTNEQNMFTWIGENWER